MMHLVQQYKFYFKHCLAIAMIMSCGCISLLTAAEQPAVAEYKLKAALIYKLTGFVEWPERINKTDFDEFGICILGRDDFGDSLDSLQGRFVGELTISIKRFSQSASINSECQIVFISDSKQAFLTNISQVLLEYPILTIGDSENFAEQGGMLQFTKGDKRIGFKVNLANSRLAGLKIAAPFLNICTVIDTNNRDEEQR